MSHTANFLVSSFLCSKRSLKPVYSLNIGMIAILRYIADSIDLNFKARKSMSTRLYQSQIAKYCHCDLKTLRKYIQKLSSKRMIKYQPKKNIFKLGQVFTAWGNITCPLDIGKISPLVRSREKFPTSNSSNITNNIIPFTENYEPSKSGEISPLLKNYLEH